MCSAVQGTIYQIAHNGAYSGNTTVPYVTKKPRILFFFFTLNGSIYSENVREDTLLIEKKKKEQHRNLNTLNAYANFIIFIGQRDKR